MSSPRGTSHSRRPDPRGPRGAPLQILALVGLLCSAVLVAGCKSTAAPPEPEEARTVAVEALREQAGKEAPRFAALDDLVVVRIGEGVNRAGDPASLVVFGRPPSSKIGCVWVSESDEGYQYEINRCPRSVDGGRPPDPPPTAARDIFDQAFDTCRNALPEEIAVAYGVPGAAPKRVIARAVWGEAAGLLDLTGQAYRGCLAGMKYRARAAGALAQLSPASTD